MEESRSENLYVASLEHCREGLLENEGESGRVVEGHTSHARLGNTNGTCAIEVLTPRFMENEWKKFTQAVLDKWMTLRDWNGNGQKLNIRPHRAKECYVSAVGALLHIE